MSHDIASSQPPPRQKPLIIAITGLGKPAMTSKIRGLRMAWRWSNGVRPANSPMSAPAMNDFSPAPVIDHDADAVVPLEPLEESEHLVAHLLGEGVELVRPVDGEDGDAPFARFQDEGFGHGNLLALGRRAIDGATAVAASRGRRRSPSAMSAVAHSSSV